MGIRHVLAGVTIVAGGLLLTACDWGVAHQSFTDSESLGASLNEVRFSNDSGYVKVTVGDKFEVRRTVSYGDTKPGRTYRMDGDALVIEQCKVRNCSVSYDVTVPEGTKVSGQLDSGNVELTGVASANVKADSGDVTVRDVAGDVNAASDSGTVELTGIGGSVTADADSGDITVRLTSPDSVTATADSGNVDVTVPDADYQVDIKSSELDNVTNDLGDARKGPKITLRTDSGSVTLKAA